MRGRLNRAGGGGSVVDLPVLCLKFLNHVGKEDVVVDTVSLDL